MKSKLVFIFLTLLTVLFISSISFATNNMENEIENAKNTVVNGTERLGNEIKNGIESTANTVENGAMNLKNDVSQGVQSIGNALINDNMNNSSKMQQNYTATRTTATDNLDTSIMNSNLWTWVAILVAGIVIVSVVWYYAKEHDER